jgi:hypothetical protein
MTSLITERRIASDLDPFCAEFRSDPYRHYAQLRALGPVVWLEKYGIWCAQCSMTGRTSATPAAVA